MAEYKHQQQDLQAGLQHLAHLRQDSVPHQGASVLQHRAALVAVQDLERQRLHRQVLHQHQAGEQLLLHRAKS
jgi:hypothetical protein